MNTGLKSFLLAAAVGSTIATPALADVWKWVDPLGRTHFVDTMKPIYTWLDDNDKVHFSDKPDHEDAISVQLVWHSKGSLNDFEGGSANIDEESAHAGETPEEREERREAEEYYCKRATEIYESYVNAPTLYRTDENGERVYLTQSEMDQAIADTRASKDELCN